MRLFEKLVSTIAEERVIDTAFVAKFKSAFGFLKISDYLASGALHAEATVTVPNSRIELRILVLYYSDTKYYQNNKPCVLSISLAVDEPHKPLSKAMYNRFQPSMKQLDKEVDAILSSLPTNGGKLSYLDPDGKQVAFGGQWLKYMEKDELLKQAAMLKSLCNKVRSE